MEIYNTLTKKTELLPSPAEQKKLNIFVCGPTVYDYIHIGNARTFVIFDVVAKYLKYKGYDVKYIQNITDIDDKIIKRARDEGTTPQKLAEKYTAAFLEDMAGLKVNAAEYAKASEYIPQIIAQVEKLINRDYAYAMPTLKAEGEGAIDPDGNQDVYFDIQKYEKDFPAQYGKLSGQVIENLEAEKRVEMEKNKRHPRDFVLWKAQNYSYDWAADSPWGKGRPGWHIEDTAISEHFFGPQYDIHGGGQDLKFPHHEAEIAQQQAASGKVPFVKYWMHAGFLVNKDEKMSKSLGNFLSLHEAFKKYSPEALRFYFLSAHYRSPLDYSEEIMKQSMAAVQRLSEFNWKLSEDWEGNRPLAGHEREQLETLDKSRQEAVEDDFNVPGALGFAFEMIKQANSLLADGVAIGNLKELNGIRNFLTGLGVLPKPQKPDPEIAALVIQRENARKAKDFGLADKIRSQIEGSGYQIDDTAYGPLIKKK